MPQWGQGPQKRQGHPCRLPPKYPTLPLLHSWTQSKLKVVCHLKISFLTSKGHGNEADFLGFLQKLVPHRSLTLPFEPFRFWLRIRGDIRNRKTTPRLGDSVSRGVCSWLFKRKLGESESRRLPDSASQGVANSPTQRVGESSTPRLGWPGSRYGIASNFLKFFIKLQHFKRLNQHFKGPN